MRRRTALVLLGATAAAVAVAGPASPGASGPAGGPVISATGRSARSAALARFGARTGGAYAAHRARTVFASTTPAGGADGRLRPPHRRTGGGRAGEPQGGDDEDRPDGQLPRPGPARRPSATALAELRQDAPPMSAELAAGVHPGRVRPGPRRALRRVGSRAAGLRLDRPGPPGHHPRRPGGGREGPVPRRGRGDPGRPGQRRRPVRRRRLRVLRPRPRRPRRPS